jgi:hypothetical protein
MCINLTVSRNTDFLFSPLLRVAAHQEYHPDQPPNHVRLVAIRTRKDYEARIAMFWKAAIIPKIFIMREEDATVPPRECEHRMVIAAIESDLPHINCVQAIVSEEFNGARALDFRRSRSATALRGAILQSLWRLDRRVLAKA